MEKRNEQEQATDEFNKQSFYTELAVQEEAKAALNQTVYMQTDPQMMPAEDLEDLSESFAGLSVGSLEPIQEEDEFGHWAERMMSMVRDLDDLGNLVTDAIHGYRAIQQSAAENAEEIRLLSEADNAVEQNQPEDIADPIPEIQSPFEEQKARILQLEEQVINGLNAPMPNAVPEDIPEMNDLAKNATDDGDEMMFFDTTNDDGQPKEWYENGEKVTGKYWPMIVGGTFV
ncbi:GL17805 [Drosophila persimilis]|uniref:GL17805 n=2 Tax=Drosophila persimilis TaxID=7234 RepID=B4IRD9_DROPE|nr:GL17805 [Drosophila persimilis]